MLAAIVPGFRQLRAPFAAGAVLLAAVYVAAHDWIDRTTHPDRLGPGLQDLSELLGPRGGLAVAAVVAYLLGTVFVAFVRGVTRRVYVRMLMSVVRDDYIRRRTRQSWWLHVAAPFSRPSLLRLAQVASAHDVSCAQICEEIILGGGKRLLVTHKDLYVEWDRMQSEAEFRDAIVLPVALFTVVALGDARLSAGAAVVVLVVVGVVLGVLWMHARRLDREAHSMQGHAIADGVVTTAAIDEARLHRP